jgi:branched-chain amino acid transport system permease protein
MVEMTYHLQLNAAVGPESGSWVPLHARGLTSWFGALFVLLTGFGLFELCRRGSSGSGARFRKRLRHEIKRREAVNHGG